VLERDRRGRFDLELARGDPALRNVTKTLLITGVVVEVLIRELTATAAAH
jgi:hypothetical protein